MVAGIGALPFGEERSFPAPAVHTSPQKPSSTTGGDAFPNRREPSKISSARAIAEHAAGEVTWPADEQERVRTWAQSDPRAVVEWASALPGDANRRFALEAIAIAWGARDSAAAARWAEGLSEEADRAQALTAIAGEAVREDPLLAIELAGSLPDAAMAEIVPRAAMEWAAQDPAAATEWARQISGLSLRVSVLAGIATVLSEQDPASAAMMAVEELPAGRLQADTIVSIVQRWNQRSPSEASEWVDRFPEGDLRDAAIESLAVGSADNR
jgi:hypothetical protein